jgi:hypothetical protein
MEEPAMAIAFIDSKGQPSADWYYQVFNQEPVLPSDSITINSRVLLGAMTVQDLLTAIGTSIKESGQSILVVSHGTKEGPSIPLVSGSKAFLQTNVLELLLQYEKQQVGADEIAPRLYFSKAEFLNFWEQIQTVRKLKLGRVELRSCNTGSSTETLKSLKWFFGCLSCCAPISLDIFGPLVVGPPGPTAVDTLLKKFPQAKITGTKPDRFGLHVGLLNIFDSAAESQKAIADWLDTHLPARSVQVGTRFPVHGIKALSGPRRIVWAGEREYRSLLANV